MPILLRRPERRARALAVASLLALAACGPFDSPTLQTLGIAKPDDWTTQDCTPRSTRTTLSVPSERRWRCRLPELDGSLEVDWWRGVAVAGERRWFDRDSTRWAARRDSLMQALDRRARRTPCVLPRLDWRPAPPADWTATFWRDRDGRWYYLEATYEEGWGVAATWRGRVVLETSNDTEPPCDGAPAAFIDGGERSPFREDAPGDVPAGWVVVPPPTPRTAAAQCANYAPDEWTPVVDGDGRLVRIDPSARPRMDDTVVVAGGRLVGQDRGEFGGQVRWEPTGGPPVRIAGVNLRGFAPMRSALLGVVGLAHLGIDTGTVVRFTPTTTGGWAVEPVASLGSAPQAFAMLPGDTLLIATTRTLVLATAEGGTRVVYKAPLWWLTYANSVARGTGGVYYLGMRSAVARVRPTSDGMLEEWLVPARCATRELVDDTATPCSCRPHRTAGRGS